LDQAVEEYVNNYFPNGSSAVFVSENGYSVYIVGNKYNPSNFWAGRWRGVLKIPADMVSFQFDIHAQIHYYEDGNVQLNSSQSFNGTLEGGVFVN
jgi:capping protein alpha